MSNSVNPLCRPLCITGVMLAGLFLPGFSALADWTPNTQEQQIASYMINDPGQKRPELIADPILGSVARARAADMASRDYFAHVNPDGVAVNYLIRKAGYVLPDWWPTDPTLNYVESIGAGYTTASAAWQGWMGSPPHKTHILGLDSFYASETRYGIGYAYNANSTYKYYWVIITAPPPPPSKLCIASPASGATVTTSTDEILVTGTTASDGAPVTIVARIENAAGIDEFHVATGVTNWTVALDALIPGANTIRVRSLDAQGVVIAEVTRTITVVLTCPLSVTVSGSGSVTAGFLGTTMRQEGKAYTITATPAPGYLFNWWSGGKSSTNSTLTFTMQEDLALQANFIVNPLLKVKGSYSGLFQSGNKVGFLKITVADTGVCSGNIALGGASYAFSGKFNLNGIANLTIARSGLSALKATLQLDLAGGSDELTGTIVDGTTTMNLAADRAVFCATTNPAPQAGKYTLVFGANPLNSGSATIPQGDGFAVISVGANGTATINGVLGDGSTFTQTTMISKSGELPLYAALYSMKGLVSGVLNLRATDASDIDGSVTWCKPARSTDVFYPKGFRTVLTAVGSRYVTPLTGVRVMNFADAPGNGVVGLGGGNLAGSISQKITLTTANTVLMATPSPQKLVITIDCTTGRLSGSFVHPVSKLSRPLRGIVLQKQTAAFGFFTGTNQTGYVTVSPAPAN